MAQDSGAVTAANARAVAGAHLLLDGLDLVLDLGRSRGVRLVDERDGTTYLDMFGFYGSNALGVNHPALAGDPRFLAELAQAAVNKPSNSDVCTVAQARFVDTFERVLGDPGLPHLFLIDGGALAVENALKAAFDWKSRRNEAAGRGRDLGTRVLHLQGAFHGRSGYTLSLTNTDPVKTDRFPRFDWPRIPCPHVRPGADLDAQEDAALAAARRAFAAHPHDTACFIAEPIQGEGGDRHLRPRFLRAMQDLCVEHDALFVLDEVQTGCGATGTAWAYQQLGLSPDVVAFGKKTQVCGVMAGRRVDLVPGNVFATSSRINSTWGGNLADMVRARRVLEVLEADGLLPRARVLGAHLLGALAELADRHPAAVSHPRGRGLLCAVTLATPALRDAVTAQLFAREKVVLLGCGQRSVRFRPPLTVTQEELDEAVAALDRVLARVEGGRHG